MVLLFPQLGGSWKLWPYLQNLLLVVVDVVDVVVVVVVNGVVVAAAVGLDGKQKKVSLYFFFCNLSYFDWQTNGERKEIERKNQSNGNKTLVGSALVVKLRN